MSLQACSSTALKKALSGSLLNDWVFFFPLFFLFFLASLKSKVQRNKMKTAGEEIEYRCLIRATDGKKTISTSVLKLLIIIYVLRQLNNVDVDGLHNEWPFMARVLCRCLLLSEQFLNSASSLDALLIGTVDAISLRVQLKSQMPVGPKDHQRFQASYATILKAHMTALKKRERKDKKKLAETDKKDDGSSKKPKTI
ncbi:hypothetical protein FEM48_Zijuj03G0130100 [Ziziphus jujuba var. spinosa]|uniref:Signal recognition particle 14 kDa protein n=1 Tax=Ziziphus jujuba var. spinosa TaxID=714518 RepID=A0A978VQG0_ZIZJJ|nr:hypothetical protein FEM48_Zijuj03G0130100 [Ziziphus jujuba var. spinosa]